MVNAQARLQSARAQLLQAEATLERTESDSRRTIELAKQGVASDQDRVQAECNLTAQQALVQSLKDQVSAAEADLNTAIANTPPGARCSEHGRNPPAASWPMPKPILNKPKYASAIPRSTRR